ncbi:putative transposase of IS4/5 family DUF4096 [Kutzneria buriramensis]|uniref:Putative transposase of IS4/5 family DUF4096 n=1 Tax=Kutzneria buriramensis TaxID=1045776 RepID=A0A3E0G3S7_9PSEU|nr:putative transposase of IS4/5 family DUF4096 [Kutzneria buriramensis]
MIELDVTNPEHLEALPGKVREHLDGVDGVLHSIAYGPPSTLGADFLEAPWEDAATAVQVSAYSLKSLGKARDAVLYVVRSGWSWRQLPIDLPPWATAYCATPIGTATSDLPPAARIPQGVWDHIDAGRDPDPSAGLMDSRTVKAPMQWAGTPTARTRARNSTAARSPSPIPRAAAGRGGAAGVCAGPGRRRAPAAGTAPRQQLLLSGTHRRTLHLVLSVASPRLWRSGRPPHSTPGQGAFMSTCIHLMNCVCDPQRESSPSITRVAAR